MLSILVLLLVIFCAAAATWYVVGKLGFFSHIGSFVLNLPNILKDKKEDKKEK